MPSTMSTSVSSDLFSSTVMTPSLPTFCIACAIILPIAASPLAEMVPTWATSDDEATGLARFSMSLTTAATAMSMPRFRSIGFMPAATDLAPSHDRLSQHGRRGGAVAGGVVGLGGDFAQHLRAHVLELVFELDFLGDGDAVLGDARRAKALFDDDVAALRPERHLDRIGENIDAAQHAITRVSGKFYVLGSHFNVLLNDWVRSSAAVIL